MTRPSLNAMLPALFLALCLSLAAGPLQAAPALSKSYNLTFATQMPLKHLLSRAGDLLAKRAAELSNGKITIKHYAGGTLFKDKEIPEAVMSGGCSMGMATPSRWGGHVSANHIWVMPFLFSSPDQAAGFVRDVTPLIDKALYAKGAKLLGFTHYGDLDGIGNNVREIKGPSDIAALKIRTIGALASAGLEAAGAAPVVMSSSEVYTALQRGTIDGAASGTTTFVSRKWMEVVKYVTIVRGLGGYPALPIPMAINRQVWDGMEPAARDIIVQASNEAIEFTRQEVAKEVGKAIATLKAQPNLKVRVIEFGSPEMLAWRKIMLEPAKKKFLELAPRHGRRRAQAPGLENIPRTGPPQSGGPAPTGPQHVQGPG